MPSEKPGSVPLEVRAENQPITETVDLKTGNLRLTIPICSNPWRFSKCALGNAQFTRSLSALLATSEGILAVDLNQDGKAEALIPVIPF